MTRRLSRKRSIDVIDQQGSVKRLKSQKPERESKPIANRKKYSTRDIPWEEQKRLGGEFEQAGENCWPVFKILEESLKGRAKKYLVAWKSHPETGEEFEPIWRSPSDVGDDLIASWEHSRQQEVAEAAGQKEKSTTRLARNRRLLPDSSDTQIEHSYQQSDAEPSPPSLLSGSSASGLEISETQDFAVNETPRVNIPPLPSDKHDYETIGSSQFSPSTTFFEQPSLDVHFSIPSSQDTAAGSTAPSDTHPPAAKQQSGPVANQTRSPQSKPSGSSPRTSSSKSTRRSKLSKFVVPPQENIEVDRSVPSRSIPLITQLPVAESVINSSRNPLRSPASTRRSARLSSPFQDVITNHNSSSLIAATPVRKQPLTPRRIVNGDIFHNRPRIDLETQTISSSLPVENLAEVTARKPSRVVNSAPSTSGDPIIPIMASSSVDMVPSEPAEGHHFAQPGHEAFDLAQDANAITLTIHESIEDEPQSSADNSQLLNSKANSSQESLSNEREVETIDGIMIPVRPLLGPNEIAISLPAEGKVKSQYDEIIKIQKKAILRFISRTGSPGTSDISNKKTLERNAMQELLQELNNTVTHTDLGLPMHTQYSLNSEANAAYAEYAGTKFELLGYLADNLKSKDCSFIIFAQPGPLQDLLEEYLALKKVPIRRHDRSASNTSDEIAQGLSIDLMTTQSSSVVSIGRKPLFIIAFDVTFNAQDQQMKALQEAYGEDLPIIHLLVANSSEHVERCVPDTLTSNIRLKVVVRTTFLASRNLGGEITYVPEASDQPTDGRVMDMSEFQRAVRKSPARRLFLIADVIATLAVSGELASNWPLGSMPELKLNELETPPKVSRAASRTPQPRTGRDSTPVSRAATPVGRKRLLDVEGENGTKRQRLTPVRDLGPDIASVSVGSDDIAESQTRKRISVLSSELADVKTALSLAEQKEATAHAKAEEWEKSHADLMHRFEKERLRSRDTQKENKKLTLTIANYQDRDEALRNEKTLLRQQVADTKADLVQARKDLTSAGGDIAELEAAREEVRIMASKMQVLEKTLQSTKADFEFTRNQYQDASKLAMDRTTEVKTLEDQVEKLRIAADDNKRSLKAMNYQTSLSMAMSRAEQFRFEVKNREALIRKLQEENATLKSRRGVQTRGSSIQPASSPGPRSRQASPAPTHLMPPSGSRTSVLRHER